MNKIQKYLLAAFGLQVILIVVVFILQRPVSANNNLLFPDLKVEAITAITISDSAGKSVLLKKQGDQWVLPLQDDFPVKTDAVQQLVEKLATIRDNRLVTRAEASHERLHISNNNFERKVELTLNGSKQVIYFGSSPATSNIHFRLDGKPEVYLTNALTTTQLSTTISGWIDPILFLIPGSAVYKIQISNNAGEFIFEPDADSIWSAQPLEAGFQFDESKWSSLLSGFTTLRFVEPVSKSEKPEYGFEKPQASMLIEFSNENGETKTGELLIGSQDAAGNYYTKWTDSEYVTLISSYNAERFFNLTANDYSSPIATEESPSE